MIGTISSAQSLVVTVLWLVALGAEVFALVDAARTRPDAFLAAGKRTKNFWVAITAVAVLLGFVTTPLSMFGIAAVVGAGVYLADVRPALRQVLGKGGGRQGPYGPW